MFSAVEQCRTFQLSKQKQHVEMVEPLIGIISTEMCIKNKVYTVIMYHTKLGKSNMIKGKQNI